MLEKDCGLYTVVAKDGELGLFWDVGGPDKLWLANWTMSAYKRCNPYAPFMDEELGRSVARQILRLHFTCSWHGGDEFNHLVDTWSDAFYQHFLKCNGQLVVTVQSAEITRWVVLQLTREIGALSFPPKVGSISPSRN